MYRSGGGVYLDLQPLPNANRGQMGAEPRYRNTRLRQTYTLVRFRTGSVATAVDFEEVKPALCVARSNGRRRPCGYRKSVRVLKTDGKISEESNCEGCRESAGSKRAELAGSCCADRGGRYWTGREFRLVAARDARTDVEAVAADSAILRRRHLPAPDEHRSRPPRFKRQLNASPAPQVANWRALTARHPSHSKRRAKRPPLLFAYERPLAELLSYNPVVERKWNQAWHSSAGIDRGVHVGSKFAMRKAYLLAAVCCAPLLMLLAANALFE